MFEIGNSDFWLVTANSAVEIISSSRFPFTNVITLLLFPVSLPSLDAFIISCSYSSDTKFVCGSLFAFSFMSRVFSNRVMSPIFISLSLTFSYSPEILSLPLSSHLSEFAKVSSLFVVDLILISS
uniref:Uncharacterized protein n=1 Tax=Cacopsylla melanoneura TaxID=428564 RepID=A0A8D8UE28_9HEMI